MTLKGVDTSLYQGRVTWADAKAAGFDFGIARCVRETLTIDPEFRRSVREMREVEIRAGAYVFLNTGEAKTQAKLLIDELTALGGPTGILAVLDVERNSDNTTPKLAGVTRFANDFKSAFPDHPLGIYGSNVLTTLGNLTALFDYLWIANYGTNPAGTWNDVYRLRGGDASPVWDDKRNGFLPAIWQFGSRGRVPWDQSRSIDLCASKLTKRELAKLAGVPLSPPQTPILLYTQAEYDTARAAAFNDGQVIGNLAGRQAEWDRQFASDDGAKITPRARPIQ